ncbi:hypothetical protein D9M71_453810 [compost metagenome]
MLEMLGRQRAQQGCQPTTAHQGGRIDAHGHGHAPLKLALDHGRQQRLYQRHPCPAHQCRGQQRKTLPMQATHQARQEDQRQAQGNAAAFAQQAIDAHRQQRHQPHAHHRQGRQQRSGLEAHAGGQANLGQQGADRAQDRPQIQPQRNQQYPAQRDAIAVQHAHVCLLSNHEYAHPATSQQLRRRLNA